MKLIQKSWQPIFFRVQFLGHVAAVKAPPGGFDAAADMVSIAPGGDSPQQARSERSSIPPAIQRCSKGSWSNPLKCLSTSTWVSPPSELGLIKVKKEKESKAKQHTAACLESIQDRSRICRDSFPKTALKNEENHPGSGT